ncbi:MAG: gamma-glutamyl-gamma-aminobutyrate hydrolase family protein [Saccharofermentanales bacterium]
MKPLIGIASNPFYRSYADEALSDIEKDQLGYFWLLSRLTEKICSSVRSAGGIPVLLMLTEDESEIETIAYRIDGLILAGGEDISPSFYGEQNKGTISPNLLRDRFEITLLKKTMKQEKPILGICRGNQVINVALGGTLYQHIPDVKPGWAMHRRPDIMKDYVHSVEILKSDLFPAFHNDEVSMMQVNSMHHQAVDILAPGLEAIAVTSDGLIEGLYMPEYRYLTGVQWHPECLSSSDEIQAGIFAEIIRASM